MTSGGDASVVVDVGCRRAKGCRTVRGSTPRLVSAGAPGFGSEQAIVVTQSFHLQRAVAVCRAVGVAAVGVGDDSVRGLSGRGGGDGQEYPEAVKAAFDVVVGRDPVLSGPRERSVDDAVRG